MAPFCRVQIVRFGVPGDLAVESVSPGSWVSMLRACRRGRRVGHVAQSVS